MIFCASQSRSMSQKLYCLLTFVIFMGSFGTAQFSQVQQDLKISREERNQLIDKVITVVKEQYVFADKARIMTDELVRLRSHGKFDTLTSSKSFADSLNRFLVSASHDKHLQILFSFDTVPAGSATDAPLPAFIHEFAIKNNYGIKDVKLLEGNIGYINILGFFPYDEATNNWIKAIDAVSETKALIIDLRNNSGGASELANFILSYFFDKKPVHLLDFVFRKDNRIEQSWTAFYLPGKRYLNKPLYILTGPGTFSAGEAFAYILQSTKLAVIVGQSTGGGANVGDLIRLNEHFVMNIPIGSPQSPVTKTNWEGSGVKPDVEANEADALNIAQKLALSKLNEPKTTKEQNN